MRATLDRLISIGGLLLAVVLLVAGGLLLWANIFITSQVHDQLAAQKITMTARRWPGGRRRCSRARPCVASSCTATPSPR